MNNIMVRLKWEYAAIWILAAFIALLYETDVLEEGLLCGNGMLEYILGTVGVSITLLFVYLALKLFVLKSVAAKLARGGAEAFRRWSEIRMAMLAVVIFFNLGIYYATLQSLGAFCTLIGLASMLFIIPAAQKLENEDDITV